MESDPDIFQFKYEESDTRDQLNEERRNGKTQ